MALTIRYIYATLKARRWALNSRLSASSSRLPYPAHAGPAHAEVSVLHSEHVSYRSSGVSQGCVQACGLKREPGHRAGMRPLGRCLGTQCQRFSFASGAERNENFVDSQCVLGETGDHETSRAESTREPVGVDDPQSAEVDTDGDLSDCPPALREFVFVSPHPFPFTVDPESIEPEQVKEVVRIFLGDERTNQGFEASRSIPSLWCAGETALSVDSDSKWLKYPEPNALWPNPLLHNHRLQPITCALPTGTNGKADDSSDKAEYPDSVDMLQARLNRTRLQKLWKYSNVHGISWDELDDIYVQYRDRQKERQQRWNDHKQQLLHYAGQVCARRLRAERTEYFKQIGVELQDVDQETRDALLQPRSLFRRMTRRLFYTWHDSYFSPWSPGGLQSVLRARITLRMLQRETNERFLHMKSRIFPSEDGEVGTCDKNNSKDNQTFSEVGKPVERVEDILRRRCEDRTASSQGSRGTEYPLTRHEKLSSETREDQQGRPWDFFGVGHPKNP